MSTTSAFQNKQPVLHTERLILRLADPFNDSDCAEIIRIQKGSDNAVSSVESSKDVLAKHKRHGALPEFCTLTPPPNGIFFLIHLLSPDTSNADAEGDLVGHILLSFRREMPYPDLGFALIPAYEGNGYASEAGKAALRFWQDTVGVKDIFIGTAPYNVKAQKLAERLGFSRAGSFDVIFGLPPEEKKETDGVAMVLPGMQWIEGKTMQLTFPPDEETLQSS